MLGTNRDLKAIRYALDSEIVALQLLAAASPRHDLSERLARLGRERIAISAVLVNRRIEASKKVVMLSRWLSGNGVLGAAAAAPASPAP